MGIYIKARIKEDIVYSKAELKDNNLVLYDALYSFYVKEDCQVDDGILILPKTAILNFIDALTNNNQLLYTLGRNVNDVDDFLKHYTIEDIISFLSDIINESDTKYITFEIL